MTAESDSPLREEETALLVEHSLQTSVLSATRFLAGGVGIAYIAFLIFNFRYLGDPLIRLNMLFDGVALLGLAAIFAAVSLGRIPASMANGVVACIGFLVLANACLSIVFCDRPGDLVFTAYIVLGYGIFMLSYIWLFAAGAVVFFISMTVAVHILDGTALMNHAVSLFGLSAFSVAIHASRINNQRRLETSRRREQAQSSRLERALDKIEQEFRDHRETEEQRRLLEEQLRQSQKMEAIGLLAGGVAHDMNNVLGAITAVGSSVMDDLPPEDPKRAEIDEILTAARRGGELTRNLLGFARKGKYRKERVKMAHIVQEVVRLLERTISKQVVITSTVCERPDNVDGDPAQLGQLLMNLCLNAVDAMKGNGRLEIDIRTELLDDPGRFPQFDLVKGRYLQMTVKDNGCGMDSTTLEHAFEPFFTTKKPGEGTGLGLAMVYGTVRNHGGAVYINSRPGMGTEVVVLLPGYEMRTSLPPENIKPLHVDRRGKLILLVDDERLVRRAAQRILTSLSYQVLTAENGQAALEVFSQKRGQIDLVVLDIAMPIMNGVECFKQLKIACPEVKVLITSGYAESRETEFLLFEGALGFLPKPYEKKQLEKSVADCLSG